MAVLSFNIAYLHLSYNVQFFKNSCTLKLTVKYHF